VDDELERLLIDEIDKQLDAFDPSAPIEGQRRALHSLKGSFGMAGERGLAEAFARFERRIVAGDREAASDAIELMVNVVAALREPFPKRSGPSRRSTWCRSRSRPRSSKAMSTLSTIDSAASTLLFLRPIRIRESWARFTGTFTR